MPGHRRICLDRYRNYSYTFCIASLRWFSGRPCAQLFTSVLDAQELRRMATIAPPLSIPLPNGARIRLVSSFPFAVIHLVALSIFFVHFHWSYLIACILLYEVRMFFVTAGYHRYFSHRSFQP